MKNQLDIFKDSLVTISNQTAEFLPKLLLAFVILILGWIIARIIKSLITRISKLLRLDEIADRIEIDEFLKKGGINTSISSIISGLFYWLVMFAVFVTAFNTLGLEIASDMFRSVILYIPNIIAAVLILIFGFVLANFISNVLSTYLGNVGINSSSTYGLIAKWSLVVFTFMIALTQLGIGEALITSAFQLLFGAICLALALAFGIGGRDWAAGIINRKFRKE